MSNKQVRLEVDYYTNITNFKAIKSIRIFPFQSNKIIQLFKIDLDCYINRKHTHTPSLQVNNPISKTIWRLARELLGFLQKECYFRG